VDDGHARRPRLREVAFHLRLLPSSSEIAGWEAFQPDHIASIAGCISNEPAFAIELRDFK
jgi:hypothetical protein